MNAHGAGAPARPLTAGPCPAAPRGKGESSSRARSHRPHGARSTSMGPARAASEDAPMTAKKDLKKRARDRQARTGESYVTALGHVRAQRPGTPIPVVVLVDLTAVGAAEGLSCRISMYPGLTGRVDPAAALARLRQALMATPDD